MGYELSRGGGQKQFLDHQNAMLILPDLLTDFGAGGVDGHVITVIQIGDQSLCGPWLGRKVPPLYPRWLRE